MTTIIHAEKHKNCWNYTQTIGYLAFNIVTKYDLT